MEIKGTVTKIEPLQSGPSKNGETWVKQNVIIETEGQYPKSICLTAFGKICDSVDMISAGDIITAHINLESREYNERWYTEVKMWKFSRDGKKEASAKPSSNESDDLPF
jgi:hypothetical protein